MTLLSCHPIIHAMLLFDLCLLGLFWACYMLSFYSILVAQHYHWACSHVVLGFLGPFHHFWAPLAHFILLGHPQTASFPWASPTHSNPPFPWIFAKSFGLLRSKLPYPLLPEFIGFSTNPYLLNSFIGPLRPILACFPFLIMPMNLLLLSSGSFGPVCFL